MPAYTLHDFVRPIPWKLRSAPKKTLNSCYSNKQFRSAKDCAKSVFIWNTDPALRVAIIKHTIKADMSIYNEFAKYKLIMDQMKAFLSISGMDPRLACRANVFIRLEEYIFGGLLQDLFGYEPKHDYLVNGVWVRSLRSKEVTIQNLLGDHRSEKLIPQSHKIIGQHIVTTKMPAYTLDGLDRPIPWKLRSAPKKSLQPCFRDKQFRSAKQCARNVFIGYHDPLVIVAIIEHTIKTDASIRDEFVKYKLIMDQLKEFLSISGMDPHQAYGANVYVRLEEYIFGGSLRNLFGYEPEDPAILNGILVGVYRHNNYVTSIEVASALCYYLGWPKWFNSRYRICSEIIKSIDS